MQLFKTTILTVTQEAAIDRLWNEEYPANLAGRFGLLLEDADAYQHHLLLTDSGEVAGWAVEFAKDGETRFSIIVGPEMQGQGLGGALLQSLRTGLDEFYGWVIDHDRDLKSDGTPYRSPLSFYLKNGFEVLSDQRIEADIISAVKIRWKKHYESLP